MSVEWYYMARGWIRRNRPVGPISEADLLTCIDEGKIQPHTLIQSSKTKGRWIPMNLVEPAMERYRMAQEQSEGM